MIQALEILTTVRLVLRRPLLSDAAAIYEYASDPEVTRYMEWRTHTDIRESVEFLETCAPRWESGQEFCWVITVKPEKRAVGAIARNRSEETPNHEDEIVLVVVVSEILDWFWDRDGNTSCFVTVSWQTIRRRPQPAFRCQQAFPVVT